MVLSKGGQRRILKEIDDFKKSNEKKYYDIVFDPENMQMVYGIIFDLDSYYSTGEYIIQIKLPDDYPLAPPVVTFKTPNGKFEIEKSICLTITHYHAESWSPLLGLEKIIQSVVSVMFDETLTQGIGFISTTDDQKRSFALLSKEYNQTNNKNILSWRCN